MGRATESAHLPFERPFEQGALLSSCATLCKAPADPWATCVTSFIIKQRLFWFNVEVILK
jgi:hypothetical protein